MHHQIIDYKISKQVQQQSYFSDIKALGNLDRNPPFYSPIDNEEDGYFDDFEDDET